MKINTTGVIATSLFVTSMLGINEVSNRSKEKCIDNYKNEIAQKDSLRYARISDYTKNTNNTNALFNAWYDEHTKMNDSIKKLGLSQKAIFEGSQLIKK